VGVEGGGPVVAGEDRRPGERLERHGREGVAVGGRGHVGAADLLRRHVFERPHPDAGAREPAAAHRLDQAEVGEVGVVAGPEQHVGRLHVAVHHPALGDVVQRLGHLAQDGERPAGLDAGGAPDEGVARGAVDVLHRQVGDPVGLPGLEHGDDVRVVEARGGDPLAREPLEEAGVGRQLARHDLEGDRPVQRELGGPVDDRLPAAAQLRVDPIAADHPADQIAHPRPRPLIAREPTSEASAGHPPDVPRSNG
jgi:hypothetical protein